MNKIPSLGIAALVIILFAVTRWPGLMPLNFSLAYGLVFCSGAFGRRLPWWMVLATLLITDVIFNVWYYQTSPFSDYMLANYVAYGAMYALGWRFSSRASAIRLAGGGLLAALVFYAITNTAAWLQNPEYAKTLTGWIQALTVGTSGWPETWKFFRNTLLSGGLFAGLIAGCLKLAQPAEAEPVEEEATEEAEEGKRTESKT